MSQEKSKTMLMLFFFAGGGEGGKKCNMGFEKVENCFKNHHFSQTV